MKCCAVHNTAFFTVPLFCDFESNNYPSNFCILLFLAADRSQAALQRQKDRIWLVADVLTVPRAGHVSPCIQRTYLNVSQVIGGAYCAFFPYLSVRM